MAEKDQFVSNNYGTIWFTMFTLIYFEESPGRSPFRKWYRSLDSQASPKIDTVLAKLELGVHSNIKWFRGIGEYVLNWGPGYRLYLIADGDDLIVLLGGGTKSGQQKDIEQALIYAKLYKARKKS